MAETVQDILTEKGVKLLNVLVAVLIAVSTYGVNLLSNIEDSVTSIERSNALLSQRMDFIEKKLEKHIDNRDIHGTNR